MTHVDHSDNIVKLLNLASSRNFSLVSDNSRRRFELGYAMELLKRYAARHPEIGDDIASEIDYYERNTKDARG